MARAHSQELKSSGDAAERLTARYAPYVIGAHGPHFIGRYYRCKGYNIKIFNHSHVLIKYSK